MIMLMQSSPSVPSFGLPPPTGFGTPRAIPFPTNSRGVRLCIPYAVSDYLSYVLVGEATTTTATTVYYSLYKFEHATAILTKLFDIKNYSNALIVSNNIALNPNPFGVIVDSGYFYYQNDKEFYIGDLTDGTPWLAYATPTVIQASAAHTPDGKCIASWNTAGYNATPIIAHYSIDTQNKTATRTQKNLINGVAACGNSPLIEWLPSLGKFYATAWYWNTLSPYQGHPYFYSIIPGEDAIRDTSLGAPSVNYFATVLVTNPVTMDRYTSLSNGTNVYKYNSTNWLNTNIGITTTTGLYSIWNGINVRYTNTSPYQVWVSLKALEDGHSFVNVFNATSLVNGITPAGAGGKPTARAISNAGFFFCGSLTNNTTTLAPFIWCPFTHL